ncbi:hypothetical protein N7462_008123 [Penicillium macrosclerotiorum]|uniref:uncharacterized protein n=1 Tax=Penicillium macrosclerotiorum TaxID=303699 RepID=UPI00254663D8|nr:uncharacterized protein N7462_008123 [Penicillium macrosclerotiorum]KAJ5679879.1 hypothetical protein N7462_008123 [Penicillium macrosclerotiorum]
MKVRRRRKTSKEERVCPVCAQAFKKAEHLARHLRSHTKEKPFGCPVCRKAFARQDTLLRHSRSHPVSNANSGAAKMHSMSTEEDPDPREIAPELLSQPSETTVIAAADHPPMPLHLDVGTMAGQMMAPMSPPNSTSLDQHTPNLSIGDSASHPYPIQVTPLSSLFSLEAGDTWRPQASPQPMMWDPRLDRDWEALLTGDDFDLDAVNLSLLYATSDYVPASDALYSMEDSRGSLQPSSTIDDDSAQRRANTVQRKWHTFCDLPTPGQTTPNIPHEGGWIDEPYRKRLAERLQQRVQHGILPSTPFLDLCIQAYFSKLHPFFPVVHMPTFRPGTQNSVLLLSICSAGSLFVGSPRAISHGISMFERLNKAILSSWESYTAKVGASSLVVLQASIIGQTFGLLMGRPKDLTGIEVWHGSLVAWARKAKLFHLQHPSYDLLNLEGQSLEDAWLAWIQIEVKKRIVLGLIIHDAELARLHHHETILRHSFDRLPSISSTELFTAPTAAHWKILMLESLSHAPLQTQNPEAPGDFALCAMLESISALASEDSHFPSDPLSSSITTSPSESITATTSSATTTTTFSPSSLPSRQCHDLLISWYTQYHSPLSTKASWPGLLMLWHSIFITLHADINALECAAGRDGYAAAQKHIPYARAWVRSPAAKRCLLHALLIQRTFESLSAGADPALHVPMCLYYAGLVWACIMCFGTGADELVLAPKEHVHFEELRLLGGDGIGLFLEQMGEVQPRRVVTGSLFRIIDLLQRISHWKIAQSLATTLLALVEETQDLF